MKINRIRKVVIVIALLVFSCNKNNNKETISNPTLEESNITAKNILGNPDYLAMSYGGYRSKTRDVQPTLNELKEDMKILNAMGIKLIRTYNVHLDQAANVLEAIDQLKKEDSNFKMYVMLGIWIDCKNAFDWENGGPVHSEESKRNPIEVKTAIALANKYPDIVKILAVGNEAMVHWAASYYVEPRIILKWVNHLQDLKVTGKLPKELWITSSDDYVSWGGGDSNYHTKDLKQLVRAVDFISMHTYPYHNTHYNPQFWKVPGNEKNLSDKEKIDAAMIRAIDFAKKQYDSVSRYVKSIGLKKPIHIGETGWATVSNGHYGVKGSRATDEYKQNSYYNKIRKWTKANNITCFYFEAFDEQWKDAKNTEGSENHFGLINLQGEAKYALWDSVDKGVFKNLTRNGRPITKTYNGNYNALFNSVLVPNTEYSR